MNRLNYTIAIAFLLNILTGVALNAQTFTVALQCEHLEAPIGVDSRHPRLSWQMEDSSSGAAQIAYQVLVGVDSVQLTKNPSVWNSGKVLSSANMITYTGKALQPSTKYYWLVRTWNRAGVKPPDSRITTFETGLMSMDNWKGSWISDQGSINTLPAPYFRKTFNATKKIRSARAYIAVGGLYELYINGEKIGNHRLDPMYTRFDRRTLYVSYDVTSQLQQGKNAVGVLLGNGWYNMQSLAVWDFDRAPWRNRPTFCMDLKINYDDGTTVIVPTDDSWKTHASPITFNSIYTGEHYDSRLELPGWNTADFDNKDWNEVILRAAPSKQIVSQVM
ncbi:MAG TPA: alpha-L-rhamnosidase N-terminal domain-containing protein, partial [Pedobacter sp.]